MSTSASDSWTSPSSVLEAVMPKGVEHTLDEAEVRIRAAVLEAVMPKGVEHPGRVESYDAVNQSSKR